MNITVTMSREEALAAIVLIENKRRKLWGWERSALDKLLKAMKLKPIRTKE